MQPLDQLLGEGLFLPGPLLHAEEGIPVIANLGDIPLSAYDLGFSSLMTAFASSRVKRLPSMKVEKWEDRTLARRATFAEGESGVRSTKARAASICIRPRAMAGVRLKRGDQMGDGISNLFLAS
jgi:hypothetical protein